MHMPPGELRRALVLVKQFWRGQILLTELMYSLFTCLGPENVADFVRQVERDFPGFLPTLKQELRVGERIKDEWIGRYGTFGPFWFGWKVPGESEEETRQRVAAEQRARWDRHFQGVYALLAHFRATDPDFPAEPTQAGGQE
jgi:hypothetical protein